MGRLAIVACVFLGACGLGSAVQVGPNEDVRLDQGVNGDVTCDRGSIYLPSDASINGDLDATYCVLKIEGSINGSITVTGGMLHIIDVPSVNGDLDVSDAFELVVIDSQFNGGADIERTRSVTVTNSGFNGDVEISGADSCEESNNNANGSIVAESCGP